MKGRFTAGRLRPLAVALVFAATGAHAVHLAPSGTGQALIYPYYTVEAGQSTLLTVVNTSDRAKALKVRASEGLNGRRVLGFNLYLAPFDVWTAAVFADPSGDGAVLATADASCTVPAIATSTSLPQLPDGTRYVPFRNFGYVGVEDDAGPDGLARTREGAVEIIEMGTLAPGSASAEAASIAGGAPQGCVQLQAAWAVGGYWLETPTRDLLNPTGGLYGTAAVVDVADGTMFAYDALALEGFRLEPADRPIGTLAGAVLHANPGEDAPTLASATSDPARGLVSANVTIDGRTLVLDYPANRAIDAVSATLMAESIGNTWATDPAIDGATEWVVAFPTRAYYVDQALVGATAIAPFVDVFPRSGNGRSCVPASPRAVSRDGQEVATLVPEILSICRQVQVLRFVGEGEPEPLLGSTDTIDFGTTVGNGGWATLGFDRPTPVGTLGAALRPAQGGTVLKGLPVTGFAVTRAINASAAPGVLASYGAALPHRTRARCSGTTDPCR